ncbi:MAG: molybdopterin biosynthesis protein [Candidatus Bathyarchaeia archaeon]
MKEGEAAKRNEAKRRIWVRMRMGMDMVLDKDGRKIFRHLSSVEEALGRLFSLYNPRPSETEEVPITEALGRVLAENIFSPIDVPGFDRAAMDGYAVRASDTFGAEEDSPRILRLVGKVEAGEKPSIELNAGEAVEVATGAPIPKGANAVVMVEYTELDGERLRVFRSSAPGENIMAAGSDVMMGELVLRRFQRLTPREIGVLAALGLRTVRVFRKPKVAILSTGNELSEPGIPLQYGRIYDINAYSLASSVRECGGEALLLGILPDEPKRIEDTLRKALESSDVVLTSGSTSAGAGDAMYRILDRLGKPGVLVHGISIKPGKPTIVALLEGKPVFGLPGYPTSALIIFNVLVRPVLLRLAGLEVSEEALRTRVKARAASRIFVAKGRREFLPVFVLQRTEGEAKPKAEAKAESEFEVEGKGDSSLWFHPSLGGSGSITSLAMADGFIETPEGREFIEEGEAMEVNLFSSSFRATDLLFMGSHCIGVDILIELILRAKPGFTAKVINAGSLGGLRALSQGIADVAGIHLLDEATGVYNQPFLAKYGLEGRAVLVRGYNRLQGFIVAPGNPKGIRDFEDLLREDVTMINRNPGSGTRILIDTRLRSIAKDRGIGFEELIAKIRGYEVEAKSHSAVAAAVFQGKADVGLGIKAVAEAYGLDFIDVSEEHYDFAILKERMAKDGIRTFLSILRSKEFGEELRRRAPGLIAEERTGAIIFGGA